MNWDKESSLDWLKVKGHDGKLNHWQQMKSSALARVVNGETLDGEVARQVILHSIRMSQGLS